MEVITELTAEQKAKFGDYVTKWRNIGLSTEPADFEKAKEYIAECYTLAGLTPPTLFVGPLDNPVEGAIAEKVLTEWADAKKSFESPEDFNNKVTAEVRKRLKNDLKFMGIQISNQVFGNQETWLSFYDYFHVECKLECCGSINGLKKLAEVCGWWTPLKDIAIIQHRPLEIHFDDQNRLHRVDGPAIRFRGKEICDVYAVHGVRVTKDIIERRFDVNDIEKMDNAEVRRVMIELYGQEKFLKDANAEVVAQDDFGTLYRKEIPGDEPLMMVKVIDATPEEDGSFKDYFIRVDPNAYGGLKTAHAAVASTWRNPDGSMVFKNPEEYDPEIQT